MFKTYNWIKPRWTSTNNLNSATFSELLLGISESPLIVENCNNVQCKENWVNLFTDFMDDERFHSLNSKTTYLKVKMMQYQDGSLTVIQLRVESNCFSYRNFRWYACHCSEYYLKDSGFLPSLQVLGKESNSTTTIFLITTM